VAGKYNIPDLGVSRAVLENKGNSPLDKLMYDLTLDICDQLREQLKQRDINTTSLGLSQSIRPTDVSVDSKGLTVGILAEDYWKYVNYGVNGEKVNRGAPNWGSQPTNGKSFHQNILEWIPKRGLVKPERFATYEAFAWAIRRGVINNGKEARPFYDAVINEKLINFMRPKVEELLGRAIEINIKSKWQ
jgi:hypothetical protein